MGAIDWGDEIVSFTNVPGMTTELNALAIGTSVISTVVDNETNESMYMDLQLHLASLDLSAQTNPAVVIHLLETADGSTTYDGADATATDDLQPAKAPTCIMPVRVGSGSETKDCTISMIPIPPGRFLVSLINETNVQFAATLNTLKYRTYKVEVA